MLWFTTIGLTTPRPLALPLEPAGRPAVSGGSALALALALSLALGGCSKDKNRSEGSPGASARDEAAPRGQLTVGQPAPEFVAIAHTGEQVRLSALRGRSVILYFYPKDDTPGCTLEAQGLRDEFAAFKAANAVVLGVSSDDNDSHKAFAEKQELPFQLLPDEEHTIADAYGVGSPLGFTQRVTFIIDPEGRVAKIFPDVEPAGHADELLAALAATSAASATAAPTAGVDPCSLLTPAEVEPVLFAAVTARRAGKVCRFKPASGPGSVVVQLTERDGQRAYAHDKALLGSEQALSGMGDEAFRSGFVVGQRFGDRFLSVTVAPNFPRAPRPDAVVALARQAGARLGAGSTTP